MDAKIEMMPSYRIAYMRHTGPYGVENVTTMEKLKSWAKSNDLFRDDSIILGIAQDNPESTRPEDCRYDVCLVLPDDVIINDETISFGTVSGGKYSVFTIDHTAEAVQNAWGMIFPELFNYGFKPDTSKPIIERYAAKMVLDHKCEICVPVL